MAKRPLSSRRDASGREDRWYVARVHQRAELMAKEQLENQAFEVYVPMETPDRTTPTGKAAMAMPLFAGYILIKFDVAFDTNWPVINNTKGVKHLLPVNREQPLPIPTAFVERIRKAEEAGAFEPDQIEDILARFVEDQDVAIVGGPFAGFTGSFRRRRGIDLELLVSCFGRKTVATLTLDQVERPPPDEASPGAVAVEAA